MPETAPDPVNAEVAAMRDAAASRRAFLQSALSVVLKAAQQGARNAILTLGPRELAALEIELGKDTATALREGITLTFADGGRLTIKD